jgi:multiple sugar transport system substrate-binding protein
MKKRSILALALSLMMLTALAAGCNINVNTEPSPLPDGNPDHANVNPDGNVQGGDVTGPAHQGFNSAARFQHELNINPEEHAGKTLTIWTFWDLSDTEAEHIRLFEAATGATVNYVNRGSWSGYDADLIQSIAAGTGPDICWFGSEVVPAWVMKGFLIPVSDFIDVSQISFPLSKATTDYYTFNGKLYTIAEAGTSSSYLFFRRDIFANASLPNPYELWKAGEWTWDRFVRLGQDVKQDLTGDGEYDIWGYYTWVQEQYVFSNGANFVQWVDGNPVEGLSDPKATRAFDWERALDEQYEIMAPWDPDLDPAGMLNAGVIAMMYGGAWQLQGLREELGDRLGIAPFPRGPDLPADIPFGDAASGHKEGIGGSSANPDLAALYLLFKRLPPDEATEAARLAELEPERILRYGSMEEYEMAVMMDNYAMINPVYGFTGLDSVVQLVRNATDMTAAQAVESFRHGAQGFIDMTWNPEE